MWVYLGNTFSFKKDLIKKWTYRPRSYLTRAARLLFCWWQQGGETDCFYQTRILLLVIQVDVYVVATHSLQLGTQITGANVFRALLLTAICYPLSRAKKTLETALHLIKPFNKSPFTRYFHITNNLSQIFLSIDFTFSLTN